jgi:hypothetical protein
MKLNRLPVFLVCSFFLLSLAIVPTGCGGDKKDEEAEVETIDSNKTNLLSVNGLLFSIPSPIQTSVLLKQSGAAYNKDLLNATQSLSSYSTGFQKAVNLGVYGADLSYVIIYGQTQDALGYLNASKKLSDDIGVSGAFDEGLMKRFEKNMGVNDSLLSIFSSAYRATDAYLKNNDRGQESGLIIAGGWIETMYFTTNILKNNFKNKKDVIARVAEQKTTLDHVIRLLTLNYQNPDHPQQTELVDQLIDLYGEFEEIKVTYTFVKPTTDVANKTTTINSTTSVDISDAQLKAITEKVAAIRSSLIK